MISRRMISRVSATLVARILSHAGLYHVVSWRAARLPLGAAPASDATIGVPSVGEAAGG
jgi:hypothetical protein